jgi:acetyl-CoA carboxylase biotin carboxyl carrier protein
MSLRFEEIAEILKIIDSSSCEEVVVETGDLKLVVRRGNGNGSGNGAATSHAAASPTGAAGAVNAGHSAHPVQSGHEPRQARPAMPGQIEITAPMVGTFYRAPSPEAPPFVEIGTIVRKGQPLCLIEVMKLFTTIYCEHEGRVAQIDADNGELVEYGRSLFVLEPM